MFRKRGICMHMLLSALLIFTLSACNNANMDVPAESYESAGESTMDNSNGQNENEISLSKESEIGLNEKDEGEIDMNEDTTKDVNITINNQIFLAKFYDNESAQTIINQMPFSLDMSDYAGQEKVTGLSFDLPAASTETPDTIKSGELYLWSGNNLVLFYTTFSNAYSYVPIGYIEDTTDLTGTLGGGSAMVSFSLAE